MDFKVWKKIKKRFSNANKRHLPMIRPAEEENSYGKKQIASDVQMSSSSTKSQTQQQPFSNDLVGEERATPEKPELIKDVGDENHLENTIITNQMSNEDYVLNVLNDLPEQWIGKEMNLRLIADKKDATWVVNRILQDVEKGLINAQFSVEESNHLCDIRLILKVAPGLASFPSAVTAINPVFSFILTNIKSEVVSRRKKISSVRLS
jgi:hypothetical protein